jgi:lipocalin
VLAEAAAIYLKPKIKDGGGSWWLAISRQPVKTGVIKGIHVVRSHYQAMDSEEIAVVSSCT